MKYNNSPAASTSHPPNVAETFCSELFYGPCSGSVRLSRLCSALQPAVCFLFFSSHPFFYERGRRCTLCTHDNMLSSNAGAPQRRWSTLNPLRSAEGLRPLEESLGVSVAEFTTFFFPFFRDAALISHVFKLFPQLAPTLTNG